MFSKSFMQNYTASIFSQTRTFITSFLRSSLKFMWHNERKISRATSKLKTACETTQQGR